MKVDEGGLPPINLLHRISTEGVVVRAGKPGHNVLCPEMPSDLRRIQAGFNTLNLAEKIVVVTKHMPCPLDEEDKPIYKVWDDKTKADYLNEHVRVFKNTYRRCLRKIKKRG